MEAWPTLKRDTIPRVVSKATVTRASHTFSVHQRELWPLDNPSTSVLENTLVAKSFSCLRGLKTISIIDDAQKDVGIRRLQDPGRATRNPSPDQTARECHTANGDKTKGRTVM